MDQKEVEEAEQDQQLGQRNNPGSYSPRVTEGQERLHRRQDRNLHYSVMYEVAFGGRER